MTKQYIGVDCSVRVIVVCSAQSPKKCCLVRNVPRRNASELRDALYGGLPHLLMCKENQHDFLGVVRSEFAKGDKDMIVRLVELDCDEKLRFRSFSLEVVRQFHRYSLGGLAKHSNCIKKTHCQSCF